MTTRGKAQRVSSCVSMVSSPMILTFGLLGTTTVEDTVEVVQNSQLFHLFFADIKVSGETKRIIDEYSTLDFVYY